jgi:serine/threonine protein kinase
MQMVESTMFLFHQHIIAQIGCPVPMSPSGVEEEMDRLAGSAEPFAQTPVCGSRDAIGCAEFPASIVGNKLIVKDGGGLESNKAKTILRLPLVLAQVCTRVRDKQGLSCISISILKSMSLLETQPTPPRCWLFTVDAGVEEIRQIVQQLLLSGAILMDALSVPRRLVPAGAGENGAVFFTDDPCHVEAPTGGRYLPASQEGEEDDLDGSFIAGLGSSPTGEQGDSEEKDHDDPSSEETSSDQTSQADHGETMNRFEDGAIRNRSSSSSHHLSRGYTSLLEMDVSEKERTGRCLKFFRRLNASIGGDDAGSISTAGFLPGGLSVSEEEREAAARSTSSKVFQELKMLNVTQGNKNVLKLQGLHRMLDPFTLTLSWTLITEYCGGGNLLCNLKASGKMDERNAMRMFHGLLAGLAHIHERDVIHRNVKPENILIRHHDAHTVLCGFGSACLSSDQEACKQDAGTLGYLAPEVIQFRRWGAEADIFAAGVVLYVSCSCRKPFGGQKTAQVTKNRTLTQTADFSHFHDLSKEYVKLVQKLLEKVSERRPCAKRASRNPWFQIFESEGLVLSSPPSWDFSPPVSTRTQSERAEECKTRHPQPQAFQAAQLQLANHAPRQDLASPSNSRGWFDWSRRRRGGWLTRSGSVEAIQEQALLNVFQEQPDQQPEVLQSSGTPWSVISSLLPRSTRNWRIS